MLLLLTGTGVSYVNGRLLIELLLWLLPMWLLVPGRTNRGRYGSYFARVVVGLFLSFAILFMFYPVAHVFLRANGAMHLATQARDIALAIHRYHEEHNVLPPAAILSAQGEPLLSWRVAILPQLGYGDLYREFHLDERWDGPNNIKLIERMPREYDKPLWCRAAPPVHTRFQLFVGPGALFDLRQRRTLAELAKADGLERTIIGGWAEHPVPWTKPEDLAFSAKDMVPALGRHQDDLLFPLGDRLWQLLGRDGATYDRFTTIRADAAIRAIEGRRGEKGVFEKLRPFITWNGGETIEWPWD